MLEFQPERVGHACCLGDSHWKLLKSSKIPVEICLTSNVRTECVSSLDDHHFGLHLFHEPYKIFLNKTCSVICHSSHAKTISSCSAVDLYSEKHPMAICTDDCGLFSTSLSHEYYIAATTFGK